MLPLEAPLRLIGARQICMLTMYIFVLLLYCHVQIITQYIFLSSFFLRGKNPGNREKSRQNKSKRPDEAGDVNEVQTVDNI